MAQQSGFTLGVNVVLRDMFSGPSVRVRNNLAALTQQQYQMSQQMMRSSRDLSLGIAAVGLMASRGIMGMVKVGAEFGYTMEFVKAITKSTTEEFELLSAKGKALAGTSIFKPTEIASGMQFMAMAGMTSGDILKNIEAATYLSQATTHQLGGKGGGADIMTNIMKGFQKLPEESMYVADVLTTAVTSANTNLFDLGEAMKYAMSTAHALGIGMEETAAGIMVLGNAGIQASMAGVAMENLLRYYSRAGSEWTSGKVSKVMASIGATKDDVVDAKGNMRSIVDFMGRIKEKTKDLGTNDAVNVMREIFGVRGNRAALQLYQNLDQMAGFVDKLKNDAPGTAMGISSKLMDTMAGRMNALASAWEAFYASFSTALEPILKPILGFLTTVVKGIQAIADTPILGTFLVGGVTSMVALTTAMHGFNVLIQSAVLMSARLGRNLGLANFAMSGLNLRTAAAGAAGAAGAARAAGGIGGAYSSVVVAGGRARWARGNQYGGRPGAFIPRSMAQTMALRGATGGATGGILSRIATSLPWLSRGMGVLGRVFSVMLGPWGLLASFLLPTLIQMFGGLISSTDRNTETKEEENKAKALDNNPNIRGPYQVGKGVIIYDNENNSMRKIGDTDQGHTPETRVQSQGDVIIIQVDGKEMMRKTIQQIKQEENYNSGIIL